MPLAAADIIEALPRRKWKGNTVHVMLKAMQTKGFVVIDSYIPTGGRRAGLFKSAITPEEYILSRLPDFGISMRELQTAALQGEEQKDQSAEDSSALEKGTKIE